MTELPFEQTVASSSNPVEVFDREAPRYDACFDSPGEQVLFQAEVEAIDAS